MLNMLSRLSAALIPFFFDMVAGRRDGVLCNNRFVYGQMSASKLEVEVEVESQTLLTA